MDDNKNTPSQGDEEINKKPIEEESNKQEDIDDLSNDIPEEDIIITTAADPAANNEDDASKKSNATCRCFQNPDGKYYCYELRQGNWVQVAIVPFDTAEECEDASC